MQSIAKHLARAVRPTLFNEASEMLRYALHDDLAQSQCKPETRNQKPETRN